MTNFDKDFMLDRINDWFSDLSLEEKIELWGYWHTKQVLIKKEIEEAKKDNN